MQVSFIGLGVMGYPMAGHLQQAGHSVSVYNRTAAKAQAWQLTYGGKTAATPAEAAAGADIIFVCVGNDVGMEKSTRRVACSCLIQHLMQSIVF